jgi:hypothetical protein
VLDILVSAYYITFGTLQTTIFFFFLSKKGGESFYSIHEKKYKVIHRFADGKRPPRKRTGDHLKLAYAKREPHRVPGQAR